MVSGQHSHILPFLGKGTGGISEQWRRWSCLLLPCTNAHTVSPLRSLCPLSHSAGFPSLLPQSTPDRSCSPGGRQNNTCLICQRFTEPVTPQAGVQGEMAFQSEDFPVAGTQLGREHTHTLPRKRKRQEGHMCRHQLSFARAMQQNHCGCYSGTHLANIKHGPEILQN